MQDSAHHRKRQTPYKGVGSSRVNDYEGDPNKKEAQQLIVDCWNAFSGRSSIPKDSQYWTLCGPLSHNGSLRQGSELRLEKKGLFAPKQFIGCEMLKAVHAANLRVVSDSYDSLNRPILEEGNIIDTLQRYQNEGNLRASLVNLDTISELVAATWLLWKTLNILNQIDGPTMVIWNFITGRGIPKRIATPWDENDSDHRGRPTAFVRDHLLTNTAFREAFRHGWGLLPSIPAMRYGFKTQMSTYVFVRTRKACGDFCKC